MANLTETATWESGIYQFEVTDLVQGGEAGIDNVPTKQLANRTQWLKARIDAGLRLSATQAYTYTDNKTLELEHIGKHLLIQHTGILGNTLIIPTAGVNDGQLLSLEGTGSNAMVLGGINGVSAFLPGMQIIIRFNGTGWTLFSTEDVGSVIAYARNSAPIGYMKCNGAAVSRTTYARLFSIIGTTFGVGDGSTTFNLPDLRGEFIRGWDDGRGVDTGRAFGSAQADELKQHSHVMRGAQCLNGTGARAMTEGASTMYDTNTQSTGGTETRPRNVALLYCIKF